MALIRPILFDPAGDAPGSELLAQGRQGGQGDLVHKGAGLLLGGGAQQVIHPGAPLLAVPEVSGGGEAPGRVLLVRDKAAAESEAEQHHDEGKRQGGDEGHGLECRQPPVLIRVPAVTPSSRAQNRRCQTGEPSLPWVAMLSMTKALSRRR